MRKTSLPVVVFNGTSYAYLYNLQGDVIGLVDSNGAEMVFYSYDTWGKMISKTGSLASTLGTIQPFRYRGYVFDEETQAILSAKPLLEPPICVGLLMQIRRFGIQRRNLRS